MALVFRCIRHITVVFSRPQNQKNLGSICKVLVPCLSFQNISTSVETINTNLQLRRTEKPSPFFGEHEVSTVSSVKAGCNPAAGIPVGSPILNHGGNPQKDVGTGRQHPLAVILAWMSAKEAHLNHYHDFYLDLGFDVLTVRTHPTQLMLPKSGAQVVAQMVLDFLVDNPDYKKLALHAFSVGGYQMGEILVRVQRTGKRYADVLPRIRAQVYDSLVDYGGIPAGFPTALTKSRFLRKVLEILLHVHGVVMYPWATIHYKASSKAFHNNSVMCPALMINSKTDSVSCLQTCLQVADRWREKGIDVTFCTFDDSKHVQHMGTYPEEYANEVLRLLQKAKLLPA
ncbi:uncharacterized protein LOC135394199 isoform X2 [Ornithodoros turicata]